MNKLIINLIFLVITTTTAYADSASVLNKFVGYTIVSSKTIIGWYDKDEDKKGDSFEGCNYNRVIEFDDNTILTCSEYGYQYAYRPIAIILYDGANIKMVVEDDTYEMTK